MPKFKLESDGTVEGTTLTVDGTELSADENIVSTSFMASVRYGKYVTFSYATKDTNEDGSTEITEYRFSYDDDEDEYPSIRKVVRPAGLGQEATEDEAALLTATTTLGAKFKGTVIDMAQVSPGHAAFVQELMRGRTYSIVRETDE